MTSIADTMALGVQHQQNGDLLQAETLFRQVLDADPQNANAMYRLAVVWQLQGRVPEAVSLYQKLLQLKPDAAKTHNNLGLAHVSQGRLADAMECYRNAIRLQPDFAEAFNNLGNLYASQAASDQAINAYRQAIALKAQYPAAWTNLGRAYIELQRWQDAVVCFQEVLASQPDNIAVLNNLATALCNQGKIVEADARCRQVLRLRPNDAESHYNLARIFSVQQRWQDAVDCLQISLSSNANNPKVYDFLGDIYYYKLGKYSEALDCYRRLLLLSPDNAKAKLLAGALSGISTLVQVPADYVMSIYNPLAEHFDGQMRKRGDCSPAWLKSALGPAPTPRSLVVLDLGCGTGLCGVQFSDWAKTLIGVDLSANMLSKAAERGIYDELILGDLLVPLERSKDRFDLILASDVLLYLGDLEPLFRAVREALRPTGRFAFAVDVMQGRDYQMTPWVHFAHSRDYLDHLAKKTGLQEMGVQPVVFPRDGGQSAAGLVVVLCR